MTSKILTNEQAKALEAFLSGFDMYVTGAWPSIEEYMRDEWGIEDPEDAIEDARQALTG